MTCPQHDDLRANLIALGWASPESTDAECEQVAQHFCEELAAWANRCVDAFREFAAALAKAYEPVIEAFREFGKVEQRRDWPR